MPVVTARPDDHRHWAKRVSDDFSWVTGTQCEIDAARELICSRWRRWISYLMACMDESRIGRIHPGVYVAGFAQSKRPRKSSDQSGDSAFGK